MEEKLTVLVIDDNPVIIRLNESLLKSGGYEMITAKDGNEGMRLAKQQKPNVILLDLVLPEKHGFEVCKELKEDDDTKDIPVIIVTGSGLTEIAKNEPDVPADSYISKPYGFKDLDDAIKNVIAKN